MEIGIYTFLTKNYGAVLQAYSLQRAIKEICPDSSVKIVNFWTDRLESEDKIFRRRSNNIIYNLIWQAHILWHYRQLKSRHDSFLEFKKKMDYTARYRTADEILNNPPGLDVHITGSDQVFRFDFGYKEVFYLDFNKGNSRKIAYAPSFGVSKFSDEDKTYIKNALSDFDALSCREKSGADFIKELLGEPVFHAIDPVFLTSKSVWKSMEIVPVRIKEYVFVFCLKDVPRLLKYAKTNYPDKRIVLLAPGNLRYYSGCKQLFYPGPSEFIGLIDNAVAVVTDSFHGTAFSIILAKEFRTLITRPEVSSRIESLLSSLGLEDHIVTESDSLCVKPLTEHVYSSKLTEMIEASREYLRTSLYSNTYSNESK